MGPFWSRGADLERDGDLGGTRVGRSYHLVVIDLCDRGARAAPAAVAGRGVVVPDVVAGGVAELPLLAADLAAAVAESPTGALDNPVVPAAAGLHHSRRRCLWPALFDC